MGSASPVRIKEKRGTLLAYSPNRGSCKTLYTRINNNVHADMYNTFSYVCRYISMNVYCTILFRVYEFCRIPICQNKRQ